MNKQRSEGLKQGGIASFITIVLLFLVHTFTSVEIPAEVAAAITGIFAAFGGLLGSLKGEKLDKGL